MRWPRQSSGGYTRASPTSTGWWCTWNHPSKRANMALDVVSLAQAANKLDHPFRVVQVASIGDLALSIFVCQGQVNWHRHMDEDELFLVHEGVVAIDTERGRLTLHSEELVVVPKGVGHRSGSQLRSIVLLFRPM